jgi:hypothetical protein
MNVRCRCGVEYTAQPIKCLVCGKDFVSSEPEYKPNLIDYMTQICKPSKKSKNRRIK